MIPVANPIYDVVFKYIMEDVRIARTILSALIKEDIVSVQMRPHEYVNDKNTNLTILRIDFAATIRGLTQRLCASGAIWPCSTRVPTTWGTVMPDSMRCQ